MIEIKEDKLPALMPEFSNVGPSMKYSYMADHLKIMNSRMVLLNPVSPIPLYLISYRNSFLRASQTLSHLLFNKIRLIVLLQINHPSCPNLLNLKATRKILLRSKTHQQVLVGVISIKKTLKSLTQRVR